MGVYFHYLFFKVLIYFKFEYVFDTRGSLLLSRLLLFSLTSFDFGNEVFKYRTCKILAILGCCVSVVIKLHIRFIKLLA